MRNRLPNEMKMDVDMFGATMEGGILGETNRTLVIAVECRWR